VPNYDIFGHQHHRCPFKDKSHLFGASASHPKWLQPPPLLKSRSELMQARKKGRVPDHSYDFDGDGVVGSLDYFIGRSFDRDCDGRLTPNERKRAEKALESGFLDKYSRGYDATAAPHRNFTIQQKRGVILSSDNAGDVGSLTYPPHFNAHRWPKHSTKTALECSRLADAKGAGTVVGERFMAANAPVPEPQPKTAVTEPRICPISNLRERAEADHQLSRVRAGLLPVNSAINPERELREVGMGYNEAPFMGTRSALLETRKEGMKQECEYLREKANELQVPLSVRRAQKAELEFEFRRGNPNALTLTKLKDQRRRDGVEYNAKHFGVHPKEYPRFADCPDAPFWLRGKEQPELASSSLEILPRTSSEPFFKVTEAHFQFGDDVQQIRNSHVPKMRTAAAGAHSGLLPKDPAGASEDGSKYLGSNTTKRWASEMLERGDGRNQPRLFDRIQPLRVGPRDLEDLDLTSSLEPVRHVAMEKKASRFKGNADVPKRSALWRSQTADDPLAAVQSNSEPPSLAPPEAPLNDVMRTMAGDGHSRPAGSKGLATQRVPAPATQKTMKAAASEPVLRATEPMGSREPRFFGTTTRLSETAGVRCGGFQRVNGTGGRPPAGSADAAPASMTDRSPKRKTTRTEPIQKAEGGAA
jgi:hypothetical protein